MAGEHMEKSRQEKGSCQNCRERHLKCDGLRPCKQCRRDPSKSKCRLGRLKFRAGSSKRFDAMFQHDQVWLGQTNNAEIKFLDMTPFLQRYYSGVKLSSLVDLPDILFQDNSSTAEPPTPWQTTPVSGSQQVPPTANESPTSCTGASGLCSPQLAAESRSGNSQSDPFSFSESSDVQHLNRHWSVDTMYSTANSQSKPVDISHHPFNAPNVPSTPDLSTISGSQNGRSPPSTSSPSPALYGDQIFWPASHTTTQCICLMRHYIQTIGPWFDIYDRAHHFSLIVPQRARSCPPLLNAIFAVAAKSLVETTSYRAGDGTVVFDGIPLPGLTSATAITYHNKCIAYFLKASDEPELMQDENLLAAAIILRYYEFLDTPRGGEIQEQFLKTFQVLVTSQASTAFSTPNSEVTATSAKSPHSSSATRGSPMKSSFRPVACWMALRLEVTSAFIKQRSIGIPLDAWDTQRSFDTADDNAWTQRLILHCADVLQFCFADEVTIGKSRREHWKELKDFEDLWELCMPKSFSPILYKEPDRSRGHYFPQVWYMSHCHVLGMQYLELARILQTVYDPTIPRLGIGSILATCQVSTTIREIVVRVCGNAISNPSIQPALITAQLAISLTGQYFTDKCEQSGMLNMLNKLESEYAWPTAKTVAELKQIWSCEEMSETHEGYKTSSYSSFL